MKKIIIITLIIVVSLISATAALIEIEKYNLKEGNVVENVTSGDKEASENTDTEIKENENNEITKEKTLNLYGTYNQNDILILDKEIKYEGLDEPITIKQISGLKNKEIENKINQDIEKDVLSKVDNVFKNSTTKEINSYMDEFANFSNVVSLYGECYSTNDADNYIREHLYYNYDLVTGNKIEFKDLFTKDADIQTVVRDALFKQISMIDNVFWDEEKGKWMENTWAYDEKLGYCVDVVEEYVPYLTESQINKIVKRIVNGKEVDFYFSNSGIIIQEPEYCSIKFVEFADMIVIYDKYLTEESIYERDDIGFKNILTCSEENISIDTHLYKETNFTMDNLFYDISISKDFYDPDNVKDKFFKNKLDDIKKEVNLKVDEYKKLAKKNPNKFYILLLNPTVSIFSNHNREKGGYDWYNLASINYNEKVISGDISKKEEFLYKLLGTYRYANLGMYRDIHGGINQVMHEGYYFDTPIEQNNSYYVFDLITNKQFENISEIFKEGTDYKLVLKNAFKDNYGIKYYYTDDGTRIDRTEEELNQMFENVEYSYSASTIYIITDGKFDGYRSMQIGDPKILPYLDLKKLDYYYIIPNSNLQNILKEDIQNLSEEELNIAYNEIFARNGHDFKSKELKDYFTKMLWYKPIENKVVTIEELSEIERNNLNTIKAVIDEKKL